MDNFNKETEIRVSAEFSELVFAATRGSFQPVKDSKAVITSVDVLPSGQTLFTVQFDAMTEDENNDDFDPTDPKVKVQHQFPATVAQVQKMAKMAKKANLAAGVSSPVRSNPNAKPPVSVPVMVEVAVEEVFDAANDEF